MFLFHKPRQHSSCVPMLDSNLTPNSGHAIMLLRMRKWPSVWWLPLTIIIRSISFYKMMWMLRALWLVVAHNLLEYMDNVTEDLFYLFFFQHGVRFWKCLWDYFGLSKWKSRKNQELFTTKKMVKWRQKELLTTWECLNCKKSLQQLPSCVGLNCTVVSLHYFFIA